MISEIIKEKTSADHLLYVSLKYTKTCDVILNLLARWKSLMDVSFDAIIDTYVQAGKIPSNPISPKQKVEFIKTYFKNFSGISEIVPIYVFFKRVPDLQKSREGEFRKNVNLKVAMTNGNIVNINLLQLDEYSQKVDNFIKEVKKILN